MSSLTQRTEVANLNTIIQEFRDSLRAINDEGIKFQKCVTMRDKLLERQTELEWLFASIEDIMVTECTRYKDAKRQWLDNRKANADAKQWTRFVGIANSGAILKKECLAPLTKASGHWGHEKVRYYRWALMGYKYCKVLGAAASRNPSWEEASIKLNQLMIKRNNYMESSKVSPNPVSLVDLERLKSWQHKDEFTTAGRNGFTVRYSLISKEDLPAGYDFDQFGLISWQETTRDDFTAEVATRYPQPTLNRPSKNSETVILTSQSPECRGTNKGNSLSPSSLAAPNLSPPPECQETTTLPSASSAAPNLSGGMQPALSQTSENSETVISLPPLSPEGTSASRSLLLAPNLAAIPRARMTKAAMGSIRYLPRKSKRLQTIPLPAAIGNRKSALRKFKKSAPRKSISQVQGCESESSSTCNCSSKVTAQFLVVIEHGRCVNAAEYLEAVADYGKQQDSLCLEHLKMYAKWMTTNALNYQHIPIASKRPAITKQRRLSLPNGLATHVLEDITGLNNQRSNSLLEDDERPIPDAIADAIFKKEVLAQLGYKILQIKSPKTWGELNDQVMHGLVSRASCPITSGSENDIEAYFLTGKEAAKLVESCNNLQGPIITKKQQIFQWEREQDKGRPINQLFRRMGNLNRNVAVQKPSISLKKASFVTMQLSDVQSEFQRNKTSSINVLDLRNPLPRSILPQFLMGENCQLLSRVRDTILEGSTAERCNASVADWNKWRDDEDWVLLAQGGAQTLTHQDSCGKATWLTVQEGQVGFGWLSRPTAKELRDWSTNPNEFTKGALRFVVLNPGQTIYFEGGTIHFVFRLSQHQTLLVGGHILRWSQVESWMQILLNQLRYPNTTNEDLLPSVLAYVEAVSQLVFSQRDSGRASELGGERAIERFINLKGQVIAQLKKLA